MKLLFLMMIISYVSSVALAQLDPSSVSISGNADLSQKPDDDLDSNHYVKKPKRKFKKSRAPASQDAVYDPSQLPGAPVLEQQQAIKPVQPPREVAEPAPDLQNAHVSPLPNLSGQTFDPTESPQPEARQAGEENPNFGHKVRDLVLGGDLDSIAKYRDYLDAQDIRKNFFEFSLGTTYFYNTSVSPDFYRNYIDSGPGVAFGLDIWLTPFLAIDGDYKTSLLNEIKDSPTHDTFVNSSHTWYDLGFKFRRFFGLASNSTSLTVGLRYADYSMSVPAGATSRLKNHTQGPELSVNLSVPAGRHSSWLFGVVAQPYLTQDEEVASSDLRVGDSNQTVGFGANIGAEYKMSRQMRAFVKLSAMIYTSQYSGPAHATDPITGIVPTNVPVSNAFYFIDFGITLGR